MRLFRLVRRPIFLDRADAGAKLAERLARHLHNKTLAIVLGLPRGGVIVGAAVARALHLPLDVIVVRKLGVPQRPELAMGAITSVARIVLPEVIASYGVSDETLEAVIAAERAELERREAVYRAGRPFPELRARHVILTDDGIATGATMLAAVASVRTQQPSYITVAAPVIAASTLHQLAQAVDSVVFVVAPRWMGAIGSWYQDFSQVSDAEVCAALEACRNANAGEAW